jgi:pyruvate/2-oxoglutarate dehydrogenase complex dihydrolipoamide acyltransferase (E2) component
LLLNLTLPRINELMTTAVIRTIHAQVGDALPLGAKLLDLSVDLSAAMSHDCPPLSLYRIAMRDRVWLRKLAVAPGDDVAAGALVALFSTEPDETLEGEPARGVRVTIAGIIDESDWWLEDAR